MRPALAPTWLTALSFALAIVALTMVGCSDARADAPEPPTAQPAPAPAAASSSAASSPGTEPDAPVAAPALGRWTDLGPLGDRRHRDRGVRAWVPAHEEGARLPLLVVLDGQGTDTWFRIPETLAALVAEGRLEPWIVVAIDSTADRSRELGRVDDRFARFLRDVVLPAARARLPVREGRESTAILGYSYGGLAAVVAGITAPDTFGRVIAMSPSLWVRQRQAVAELQHVRRLPVRLWIDVGSREPDAEDVIPYMVGDARDLRDVAIDRGMVFGRDVGFDEALGEGHDMSAAGRRMRGALLFGLGARDLSSETPRSLAITRYPAHRGRATHAIQASYASGEHLTFPESQLDVRSGDTRLTRDIAHVDRPLSVHAFGLEAHCD